MELENYIKIEKKSYFSLGLWFLKPLKLYPDNFSKKIRSKELPEDILVFVFPEIPYVSLLWNL